MFIGRAPDRDFDDYTPRACKKSSPALHNTFMRPPIGNLEGIYIRTLTVEGAFGYVPSYADDEIKDDDFT